MGGAGAGRGRPPPGGCPHSRSIPPEDVRPVPAEIPPRCLPRPCPPVIPPRRMLPTRDVPPGAPTISLPPGRMSPLKDVSLRLSLENVFPRGNPSQNIHHHPHPSLGNPLDTSPKVLSENIPPWNMSFPGCKGCPWRMLILENHSQNTPQFNTPPTHPGSLPWRILSQKDACPRGMLPRRDDPQEGTPWKPSSQKTPPGYPHPRYPPSVGGVWVSLEAPLGSSLPPPPPRL